MGLTKDDVMAVLEAARAYAVLREDLNLKEKIYVMAKEGFSDMLMPDDLDRFEPGLLEQAGDGESGEPEASYWVVQTPERFVPVIVLFRADSKRAARDMARKQGVFAGYQLMDLGCYPVVEDVVFDNLTPPQADKLKENSFVVLSTGHHVFLPAETPEEEIQRYKDEGIIAFIETKDSLRFRVADYLTKNPKATESDLIKEFHLCGAQAHDFMRKARLADSKR